MEASRGDLFLFDDTALNRCALGFDLRDNMRQQNSDCGRNERRFHDALTIES